MVSNYLINIGFEISQHQFIYNVFNDPDRHILHLLERILGEYKTQDSGHMQVIRSILSEVIILTMRKVQIAQRIYFNNSENEISEIISLVHDNFPDPPSLKELSRKYSTSISSLSKKFKERTGYTYSFYIQMKRMEHACRLLVNTDAKVANIAYDCGYTDIKHFNFVFKRVIGCTPTAYRKFIIQDKGR